MNEGFQYRSRLGGDATGVAVLDYLSGTYSKTSRDEWMRRIGARRVLVNGVAAEPRTVLQAGQLLVWARPPWEEPRVPLSFAILHHDANVLAVAKPSGLPTMPGGGAFVEHTLLSIVRRHFPGASPLHRLGRATSGIVLCAGSSDAFSRICRQWRSREVVKVYRALVAGSPVEDEFSVNVPIGPVPHPLLGTIHAVSPSGKQAHSHVRVLERRGTCTLVEVRITTGRPHQIRIHLAAAGHPLVGDRVYTAGGAPIEDFESLPGDAGYHLHAGLLGFVHPATGEWTEIICGPPPLLRTGSGTNLPVPTS